MGLGNNTRVRVKIKFDELVQAAFRELVRTGEIPYVLPYTDHLESAYNAGFENEEERTGLYVEFYVRDKTPKAEVEVEPEPEEYELGSWKDHELENDNNNNK